MQGGARGRQISSDALMWTGLSRPREHNSFDLAACSVSAIYVPARPPVDDDGCLNDDIIVPTVTYRLFPHYFPRKGFPK